jgi:hypothetical protein
VAARHHRRASLALFAMYRFADGHAVAAEARVTLPARPGQRGRISQFAVRSGASCTPSLASTVPPGANSAADEGAQRDVAGGLNGSLNQILGLTGAQLADGGTIPFNAVSAVANGVVLPGTEVVGSLGFDFAGAGTGGTLVAPSVNPQAITSAGALGADFAQPPILPDLQAGSSVVSGLLSPPSLSPLPGGAFSGLVGGQLGLPGLTGPVFAPPLTAGDIQAIQGGINALLGPPVPTSVLGTVAGGLVSSGAVSPNPAAANAAGTVGNQFASPGVPPGQIAGSVGSQVAPAGTGSPGVVAGTVGSQFTSAGTGNVIPAAGAIGAELAPTGNVSGFSGADSAAAAVGAGF